MLREKNRSLYMYGVTNLNFKFNNNIPISKKKSIEEADDRAPLTELEELSKENNIWRRRNCELYKYGVKKILNFK